MRIRTIKPEFFQSRTVAGLSIEARLLFVGLWLIADDAGRGERDPRSLRAELFRFDDFVSDDDVDRWFKELVGAGVVEAYEGRRLTGPSTERVPEPTGRRYALFHVRSFEEHQSIKTPSLPRFEPPPADPSSDPDPTLFPNTPPTLPQGFPNASPGLPQDSPRTGTGSVPDQYRVTEREMEREREREREQGKGTGVRKGKGKGLGRAKTRDEPEPEEPEPRTRWSDKANPWSADAGGP
jgi:hypothetical protein